MTFPVSRERKSNRAVYMGVSTCPLSSLNMFSDSKTPLELISEPISTSIFGWHCKLNDNISTATIQLTDEQT